MGSIEITDSGMVSSAGHTATFDVSIHLPPAWVVSWCPQRRFDRDQAITALTLAEFVCGGTVDASHKRWPLVRDLAAELDMDPAEAVRLLAPTTPGREGRDR